MSYSSKLVRQILLFSALFYLNVDGSMFFNDLAKRVNCAQVTGALATLKNAGPLATSFCSSYLHIPSTSSITATVTTPTSTTTVSTATVTVTSSACTIVETIVLKRAELLGGMDIAAEVQLEARNAIPPGLASYAAAQISSACSCLGLAPKSVISKTIVIAKGVASVVATTTACSGPDCYADGTPCTPDTGCCNRCCGPYDGYASAIYSASCYKNQPSGYQCY